MNRTARWLLLAAMSVLVVLAAWRVGTGVLADRLASTDPARVLRWRPGHPDALLALTRRQLADGQAQAATATARRLLAVEPLHGDAFGILAAAAEKRGDRDQALALYRIAVRRAPRDARSRAWLADHDLQQGRHEQALAQIDVIMRIAPEYRQQLYPALAQLARDPAFASALVRILLTEPTWRGGFLETLQLKGEPAASSRVLGELQVRGGLSAKEFDRWLALLIHNGRWGEAYSRWAGSLELDGAPLPAVYNGGFQTPPSGSGFDWRSSHTPGVQLQFVAVDGADGLAAHAHFSDRPVAKVNLEQPLLLAPGNYRLTARTRARALEAEFGLEWQVTCADRALASSERMRGSFDWRRIDMEFTVPEQGCPGQWLRLRNPAPRGVAQRLSGDLWFDDVDIHEAVIESR